ncbi:hypothetical protein GB937_000842 [Aspergillus fischeri]|nr:hypothetical protein GB937_000842 [Aspergillus fischeri]
MSPGMNHTVHQVVAVGTVASSVERSAPNSSSGIPESNVNTRRSSIGMSTECSLYSRSHPKGSLVTPLQGIPEAIIPA